MSTAAKRIGGPVKSPEPGKRAPMSLLVPPALKARIGKLAEKNGRTLAAEAEALIERAFAYERALGEFDAWSKEQKAKQAEIERGNFVAAAYREGWTVFGRDPTTGKRLLAEPGYPGVQRSGFPVEPTA